MPHLDTTRFRSTGLHLLFLLTLLLGFAPGTAVAQDTEEVPLSFQYRVITWPYPTPDGFRQRFGAAMVVEFQDHPGASEYQLTYDEVQPDGTRVPQNFRRRVDPADTDDKRRVFDSLCTQARVDDGRCPTFEEFPSPNGRWILAISLGPFTTNSNPDSIRDGFLNRGGGVTRDYHVNAIVPAVARVDLSYESETKVEGEAIEGEEVGVTVNADPSREAEQMTVTCQLPKGTSVVDGSVTDGGKVKGRKISWDFGTTSGESMQFRFVVGKQKSRVLFLTTQGSASADFDNGEKASAKENLALRYLRNYAILDVADANPTAMNGLLLPDPKNAEQVPDLDFSRFRFVDGIAADGVSLLLLRAKLRSKKHGKVVLSLEQDEYGNVETGGLFALDDVSLLDTSTDGGTRDGMPPGPQQLTLDPQKNKFKGANKGEEVAFALYRAPRNFDGDGTDAVRERTVRFQLDVYDEDDGSIVESTEVEMLVVRPLVVLQHGTFDQPTGWDDFPLWQESGRAPTAWQGGTAAFPFHVGRSDFSRYRNAAGRLIQSAPYAYRSLRAVLDLWKRQNKYAAAQVDVICHSYGGVNMRWIAQTNPAGDPLTVQNEANFRSLDNWGHGSFHKLITIASTHRGSAVSNQLAYLNQFGVLQGLIKKVAASEGSWIDRGAVEDQMVLSPRLRQLQRTRVPGHAIAGSGLAHFNPDYRLRLSKLVLSDKLGGPFQANGVPVSATAPDIFDEDVLRKIAMYGFNLDPDNVRDDTSQDPNFDLTVSSYSSKANMPVGAFSDFRHIEATAGLAPNALEGLLTHGDQISAGGGRGFTTRATALRVAFLLRQDTDSTFFAEFPGVMETPMTALEQEFSDVNDFPPGGLYLDLPAPLPAKFPAKATSPVISVVPDVSTVQPGDQLDVTVSWPDVGVDGGYLVLPDATPGGGQLHLLASTVTTHTVTIADRAPEAFSMTAVVRAPDGEYDTVTREFELTDGVTYTQLEAVPESVRITTPHPGATIISGRLPGGAWRRLSDSPRLALVSGDEDVVTIDEEGNFAPVGFGATTVTATFDGGPSLQIPVEVAGALVPVTVTPRKKNKLKAKKKRPADFVFLSSPSFDPADIEPDSVRIAGLTPLKLKTKDVNKDGVKDLVAFVRPRDLGLEPKTTASIRMFAVTTDGSFVSGTALADVR